MAKKARIKENLFSQSVARNRLVLSRYRAKLTQWDASRRMGYANTSKLSKLESISSSVPVSFRDLVKAADCYGVSVDYLLGRSDYPDRDLESIEQLAVYHSTRQFIQDITQSLTEKFIAAAEQHSLKFQLTSLCDETSQLIENVKRLRELNPEFDDVVRGGAKVFSHLSNLEQFIAKIQRHLSNTPQESKRLKQFKAVLEEAKEIKQLDMFNGE